VDVSVAKRAEPPRFSEGSLSPFLAAVWTDEGPRVAEQRVVPDGCLDILLFLAEGNAVVIGAKRLRDLSPPDPRVAIAVGALWHEEPRIESLAARLNWTRQHLGRVFRDEVGLSPKQLARIGRFQRTLHAMSFPGSLAEVAAEAGYFDEGHMRATSASWPGSPRGPRGQVPFFQFPRPCRCHLRGMKQITTNLIVERIEDCLPFWVDRLGFEKTVEVPDGDRLGFVILEHGEVELMLQTRHSLSADVAAIGDLASCAFLYIHVDDLAPIRKALEGWPLVIPERTTSYGQREIIVRDPANNVVAFAAPA
jgi:AraC-like DNA-binding protein/catechol 2,3-dioxygenase-like lactoylglutathione lyase family enzyme